MQRQPPPPPPGQDVFKLSDTDSNGLVSKTELSTLVKGIEEVTGNTIDVDDALSTYDADQDGGLNGEELLSLLENNGFSQPLQMLDDESGESASQPPPPPPPQQEAMASYARNSVDDLMQQLLDRLRESGVSETDTLAIDVTS
jgi:hypothetical protein